MSKSIFRTGFSALFLILLLGVSVAAAAPAAPPSGDPILFDFSEFQDGEILDANNPYTKDGVEMRVELVGGSTETIVFDSATPYPGDLDLGSPNQNCVNNPGPGVGDGGIPTSPGANCSPVGNTLIIADNISDVVNNDTGQGGGDCTFPDANRPSACDGRVDVPNDSASGGRIQMTFRSADDGTPFAVDVSGFELLDVEPAELQGLEAFFYDDIDCTAPADFSIPVTGYGNNSYEQFNVFFPDVLCIGITFSGSGSIPGVLVTPSATETAGLGNYVWWDEDGNGVQDDGDDHGINGVTVNLYRKAPNGDLTFEATTTTDTGGQNNAPGYYEFLGLEPTAGKFSYIVEFIRSANFQSFTTSNAGSASSTNDSDAEFTSGRSAAIKLDPGEYDPSIDAGLLSPSAVSLLQPLGAQPVSNQSWVGLAILPALALTAAGIFFYSRRLVPID